jgi:hypothetical protein
MIVPPDKLSLPSLKCFPSRQSIIHFKKRG